MRVTGLACCLLFAVAAWGQSTFHGNLARNGVYEGGGPKTLGGVKWTFTVRIAGLSDSATKSANRIGNSVSGSWD